MELGIRNSILYTESKESEGDEEDDQVDYIKSFRNEQKDDRSRLSEGEEGKEGKEGKEKVEGRKRENESGFDAGDDGLRSSTDEVFVNISLTNTVIDRRKSSVGRKIEDKGSCDKSKCWII